MCKLYNEYAIECESHGMGLRVNVQTMDLVNDTMWVDGRTQSGQAMVLANGKVGR